MRHDAIEIGPAREKLKTCSRRRARRRKTRAISRDETAAGDPRLAVDVIDEAFAGFTRTNARVTRVDRSEGERSTAIPQRLVAGLSAQLYAVERQRSQLVQLLDGVDSNSNAI